MKNLTGHSYPDEPKMPRMLPSFNLTAKDLSAIKEWKVGQKYKLEIEVKMTSLREGYMGMGEPMNAGFEITKLEDKSLTEDEKQARKGY